MTQRCKDCAIDGACLPVGRNVTPALKNLEHPLYKIFGDIPAGSSLPAVGRGFHPRFSEALQRRNSKLDRINIFMLTCEEFSQGGWYGV